MKWTAYASGGIGILLLVLAILQSFTAIDLLDSPSTGGIIFLFLGFSLLMIDYSRAARANREDNA